MKLLWWCWVSKMMRSMISWEAVLTFFSIGKLSWRSENLIEKIVIGRWAHKGYDFYLHLMIKARVRCWRLVLTEHMVKLLIIVGLLHEAKEVKKRNFNQTLSLILQLTIYLSPPRPRRIKKVCMRMIHSIGWGGIKASKPMRCTDPGLGCYYVPWLREMRGFQHKHMHFNTCKLVVEVSGDDRCNTLYMKGFPFIHLQSNIQVKYKYWWCKCDSRIRSDKW